MNKTIIININGTVFHIEEDAYEILKKYMTDVKRHFMHSADSLEITTDIENRIAEMFSEILQRDNKQALVEQDVQYVTEQMGSVEDFEEPGFENPAEKMAYTYSTINRKLFRDADDRIIAGVCSGMANYFDFKPIWVRLAFLITFMFFGTGLWIYIILWIVVPKATTRSDRMAMKGEKLNLQGFKRNFEEEMGSMHDGFKNLSQQSRPFVYKTRDFAGDFFSHLGTFLKGTGKLLVKVLGGAIVIAAFAALLGLVALLIGFIVFGSNNIYDIFPFNIVNYQTNSIFLICGFLMLGIPLITIMLLSVSALFKSNSFNRTTGFTLLTVWIASLLVVMYYSALATANFRQEASLRKTIAIQPSSKGVYYLKLNDIKYLSQEDSTRLDIKGNFNGMSIVEGRYGNDLDYLSRNVRIEIEKSDVTAPILVETFSARGKDYEEALNNARNTTYLFEQQDSVLKFSGRIEKKENTLWRDQQLHLLLKLPINTQVIIDDDMNSYLHNIDMWGCKADNKKDDATSATFIITADGLQCKVDTLVLPQTKVDTAIFRNP